MLIEPTRVRSKRDRRVTAVGLVLVGLAACAMFLAVVRPGTPLSPGPLGPTAEADSSPARAALRRSVAPDVVPIAVAGPFLYGRLAEARGPDGRAAVRLVVNGWLPTQYGWAAVDIVSHGRSLGGPALRVEGDGTFSDTLSLDPDVASGGIVVRLSGLDEEQLQAVPLLTVTVSPPAPGGPAPRKPAATQPR